MKYFLLLFSSVLFLNLNAQQHVCGVSTADQLLSEKIAELAGPTRLKKATRGEKIYIPVAFHIVTLGNGTGGVRHGDILKQLCKLNNDYAEWDIVFYSHFGNDYPIIESDNAYNMPRDNENVFRNKKDENALNVFITGNIGESGAGIGFVLGYYSPSNDLVVCRIAEFANETTTLSHELGHFFSLRHTFFGWEACPYEVGRDGNPLDIGFIPCGNPNSPIELMDKSNCAVASDQICDTPPDYNFGLGDYTNGCGLTIDIKDSNGELIITQADNQMGYFQTCTQYYFTQGQYDRILNNYNNASRDFLKTSYIPNETPIFDLPNLTSPANFSTVDTYNGVNFEWEASQNADFYLLEIDGLDGTYRAYYSNTTSRFVSDLDKNEDYYFKVTAFNDGYTCVPSTSRFLITTGSQTTSTVDQDIFANIDISPNPVSDKVFVNLESAFSGPIKLEIVNVEGMVLQSSSNIISTGFNKFLLDVSNCSSGVHFIKITSNKGSFSQKLSIVK